MGGGRGYPDAEESRCEQCNAVCRQHAEVKGTNRRVHLLLIQTVTSISVRILENTQIFVASVNKRRNS
jgi:hypothetical protein